MIQIFLSLAGLLLLSGSPRPAPVTSAAGRQSDTIPTLSDSLARVCTIEARDTAPQTISLFAHSDNAFTPTVFCFQEGGAEYVIGADGTARRGELAWRIPIDSTFSIEGLYYARRGAQLFLMYQVTDGDVGTGYLFAVDVGSLQGMWKTPVLISLNLSPPLLSDSVAYLAGLNVVEKVRLRTGALVWRHVFYNEDLARSGRSHFYSFRQPWVEDGLVHFPEKGVTSPTRLDTLRVVDSTGRIVSPTTWSAHAAEP